MAERSRRLRLALCFLACGFILGTLAASAAEDNWRVQIQGEHRRSMQQLVKFMNEMGVVKAGPHKLTSGRKALEEMRWWTGIDFGLGSKQQAPAGKADDSVNRRKLTGSESPNQESSTPASRGHTAGGKFRRRGGVLSTLPFERANVA